jgi:hypothetical protein
MKEPKWESCTEEELWKYVASHLSLHGIDTILVGGAVAAIYSDGAYHSGDLDFVILNYLTENLPKLMKEIGFERTESRHYSHPKCRHLIVEFTSPPAAIGEDYKIKPKEVKVNRTVIRIYSPTDCIRDRLASYIHFKAKECMDQAVLVAQRQKFNSKKIQDWCKSERTPEAFEEFKKRLDETRPQPAPKTRRRPV